MQKNLVNTNSNYYAAQIPVIRSGSRNPRTHHFYIVTKKEFDKDYVEECMEVLAKTNDSVGNYLKDMIYKRTGHSPNGKVLVNGLENKDKHMVPFDNQICLLLP